MILVRRSTILEAPPERVWALLRNFNGHDRWHPAVGESRIEEGLEADLVGCVRNFSLAGGGRIREQLLSLSDRERSFTYCILEAPVPLMGYVATVRLKPVTDGGGTFLLWEGRFEAPAGREAELSALVGREIYEAGFAALRGALGLTAQPRSPATGSSVRTTAAQPAVSRSAAAPVSSGGQRAKLAGHGLVLKGHGGPEMLEWRMIDAPPPGQGQVRLRHEAVGVNFIDVYCRSGYFDLVPPGGVLGMEAAGVVLDVGPGVHGLAPGDRVAYACPPPGAYCELRTLDAALLALLPAGVTSETAAAGLLKGMTAEFLLHRVHAVKEGDVVLIHAAAGGVGLLLCQWARHLGATVIGTVGSEEKARLARSHGCSFPILYSRDDFVAIVMEITDGRGADVIYDAVGRDTFERSYQALALRGHLVSFGQASGPIAPIDIAGYAGKSATVSRPNYGHYTSTPEAVRSIGGHFFEMLLAGRLSVEIGLRLPLRQAAEAHRRLEARETLGSTILLP